MINPNTFTAEHIQSIRGDSKHDPSLIERSIFALGLLEALTRAELPFIFKGGTSLMLLMDKPRRFSTDIDLVVAPGVDVEKYLERAAVIWPFMQMKEDVRFENSGIEKRHIRFTYTSPRNNKESSTLLDILYEENPYSTTIAKNIDNELLVTEDPAISVLIPNANCIIADKLTAFAPYTTGIKYDINKELEIIKQLYDIAALLDYIDNFAEIISAYNKIVRTEIAYRSLDVSTTDVLNDTINTAACVAGRGKRNPEDYAKLRNGVVSIRNHIFYETFNGEVAVQRACMVMYLAAAVLTEQITLPLFRNDDYYKSADIDFGAFHDLRYVRKMDMLAYKYLVEAIKMLLGQ